MSKIVLLFALFFISGCAHGESQLDFSISSNGVSSYSSISYSGYAGSSSYSTTTYSSGASYGGSGWYGSSRPYYNQRCTPVGRLYNGQFYWQNHCEYSQTYQPVSIVVPSAVVVQIGSKRPHGHHTPHSGRPHIRRTNNDQTHDGRGSSGRDYGDRKNGSSRHR